MKYFTLLCFITFLAFQCHAQQTQDSADKLFYIKKIEKYRRLKNTGTFLTVTGGVLFIVTVVTVVKSINAYQNGTPQQQQQVNKNGASADATLLGSAVGLGAGIPLWIVGSHAQRKYEKKLQRFYVTMNVDQNQRGITLRYRF